MVHFISTDRQAGIQSSLRSLSRPVCVNSAGLSVDIKWTLAGYFVGLQWARSGHCIFPFGKMQHLHHRYSHRPIVCKMTNLEICKFERANDTFFGVAKRYSELMRF